MSSFLCISNLEKTDDSEIREVLEALPNEIIRSSKTEKYRKHGICH